MAKEITIKNQEGVSHIFALKEIILKGEIITQSPSGARWSDGLTKPYVYGESYVDALPDAIIVAVASQLIPTAESTETEGE